MKHKFSGIIVAALLLTTMLFTSGAAYAQDEGLPSPGITPDSPFYFFDKLGKSISLAFTFGSEDKARKTLKYADERLAEAQEMASENKTADLETAIAEFEKYIASLQDKLAAIKQQVASDNISEQVALAIIKHLDVLEKIKDRVPEPAKNAIGHAENVSMNGQLNALRALGKDKPERALDICDNVTLRQMEKIKNRASDNVTSDNLTALLDYTDRIAELEDEMTDIAAASGANVTALQERLAHSTSNRLQVLSGVYERVPEQAQPAIANAIENSVKKYERAVDKLASQNVTSAASVNETISKAIPEKLKEKLQISTSNRAQIANANQMRKETKTENQEENKDGEP